MEKRLYGGSPECAVKEDLAALVSGKAARGQPFTRLLQRLSPCRRRVVAHTDHTILEVILARGGGDDCVSWYCQAVI